MEETLLSTAVAKSPKAAAAKAWISAREAGRILGRSNKAVVKLAAQGHVRSHQPPGLMPRYYRPDVEKFKPAVS